MNSVKSTAYKNLVAEMQNKYPLYDKNSDAELFAPVVNNENICKEINLYTYWQGFGYAERTPKIKYLFVLQDYGCIFDEIANLENIKKINAGYKNAPYLSKKFNGSETDKNLVKLFKILGYDLNKHYDELFFTNFCLGYRKNSEVKITRELMMQDAEMFKKLCEILEPENIIAMGRKTFECVYKSLTGEDNAELLYYRFWNIFLENHDEINVRLNGDSVKIIPVAHCGTYGIENRNAYNNNFSNHVRDWTEIKKLIKNYNYKTVDDAVKSREETFSEFLFQLISERNLQDPEVYKKVDMNRKIFSDIRKEVIPKKINVIKIIFALELSIDDAQKLLSRAGYALSPSSDFDLIVTHFISTKNFNQFEMDAELDRRNLPCIFSEK